MYVLYDVSCENSVGMSGMMVECVCLMIDSEGSWPHIGPRVCAPESELRTYVRKIWQHRARTRCTQDLGQRAHVQT